MRARSVYKAENGKVGLAREMFTQLAGSYLSFHLSYRHYWIQLFIGLHSHCLNVVLET